VTLPSPQTDFGEIPLGRTCARQLIELLEANDYDVTGSIEEIRQILDPLLAHEDLLEIAVPRDPNHIGRSWWLYYDPELSLILAEVKQLEEVPVHNHGTFEIASVYQGAIKYSSYIRKDDGTASYYAELETTEDRIMRAGDIAAVPLPPNDIHGFVGLAETSYILGISGALKPDRLYFDPHRSFYVERQQQAWRHGNKNASSADTR
jgi:predicted metal-dependent enzyme (double-stranded beta helix superfamily)